jgi:hypothetical protein
MLHPPCLCRALLKRALTGILLTLLGLSAPRLEAAAASTWHFEQVSVKKLSGAKVGFTYEILQADLKGGRVRVTEVGGPPTNDCPGGSEAFLLNWSFDRDLTMVTSGETFNIAVRVDRYTPQAPCNGALASLTGFSVYSDPNGWQSFPEFPLQGELFEGGINPMTFYPLPNTTQRAAGLVPLRVTPTYSAEYEKWGAFSLHAFGPGNAAGGFNLAVLYVYAAGAGNPPDPLAQQARMDMFNEAADDPRFGAPNYSTLGGQPNWMPPWDLWWMDFAFTGGRVVRVYQATNRTTGERVTTFFDPDTNAWTTWEPAVTG